MWPSWAWELWETGVYKVLKMQQDEMEDKIGAQVEIKKILVRNLKRRRQRSRSLSF